MSYGIPAYNSDMRRLALIATLALLIAPASAQMRSAGRGGMGGRGGGFAPHGFVGAQGRHFSGRAWSRFSPGFGSRFGRGFDRGFHHHRQFFRSAFAYVYWGYPLYWGNYDPWVADYSGDYGEPNNGYYAGRYDQQAAIEQRLDRIEDRIDRLLDRLQAPPAPPSPPQSAATTKTEPASAATLVFRDGHTEQIENYAVVGHTLWIFNEQRARKVPLADINIGATEQTNQQRGIDLHLPTG